MNDDRAEELIAPYALDLLEGAEKAEFEAALERDPALRRQAAEWREAAAALAYTAPAAEPPAALRARILQSAGLAADSDAGSAEAVPPARRRLSLLAFPALLPWAAAACFALAAAWTGRMYVEARSEAALLHDQERLADLELRSARNQLEAERIVSRRELATSQLRLTQAGRRLADSERRIASLTHELQSESDLAQFKISVLASMLGNSSQALAVAVWNPARQEGVLSVSKLPAAAENKDYQLWVIDPGYPAPVSGGVFTVDPATGETRVNFHAEKRIKSASKFAVSLERKGGSPAPAGPIILVSQ